MVPPVAKMMTAVREQRPLVHHITNYVTVNDCANITLCAGGSPVMTDAGKDIPEMVRIASAVVLNIGTLKPRTVESMIVAGKEANDCGIPVILDPVGAGATLYRTETIYKILDNVNVSVIKGNAGEIATIAGTGGEVKGVDSAAGASDAVDTVKKLAAKTGAVIGMTGPEDYVSDGKTTYKLTNGDRLLECVSGTGCMVSSVVGCYTAVHGVNIKSVAAAISVFNIAAEIAAESAKGPGSFKVNLFDSMYNLKESDVKSRIKMEK